MLRRALPQACALCNAPSADALICNNCVAALPRLESACPVCALLATDAAICGACLSRPPPFARTIAVFVYQFPVDRLVHELKYRGRLALAHWAADELARAVRGVRAPRGDDDFPHCVVALPLSKERQRERGFNQAREIAARVASALGLPLRELLTRRGGALPQAALPWSERAKSIRGAFAGSDAARGLRIALIDDVMTTGATVSEAAATLRDHGAASVECWVVARTLPPAA